MTPAPLVFLIPCRLRGERLEACINSIAATVNIPFHIVVGFDDDATSFNQLRKRPYVTKFLYTPRHYFVRTMNRLFEDARALFPKMTYFVVCNDDDFFSLFDWGVKAIATHQEVYPDNNGVIELFWSGRIHCYISHVATFADNPWIYNPVFTQYYADHELWQMLVASDRYTALDEKNVLNRIVSHNVMSTLDALASETFQAWHESDAATFLHLHPTEKA